MRQTLASTDDQRIREMAYHLWEKDGRPHGLAERHWEMAARILTRPSAEPVAAAKTKRAPAKRRRVATS